MDRRVAIVGLCLFGLVGLAAAGFGAFELLAAHAALRRGDAIVAFDTSSFVFIGAACLAALPLLALFRKESTHAVLFAVLVVWFLGAPIVAHQAFVAAARAQGYPTAPIGWLLTAKWVELRPDERTPR